MSVVDDWSPPDPDCQPIRDRLTVIVQWYDDFWSSYFAGAAGEVTRIMVAISELEEAVCDGNAGPDTEISVASTALITPAPLLLAVPCPAPVEQAVAYQPVSLVTAEDMLDVFSMTYPCQLQALPAPAPIVHRNGVAASPVLALALPAPVVTLPALAPV